MRLLTSLVSSLLFVSLAVLPGCGTAPVGAALGARSADSLAAQSRAKKADVTERAIEEIQGIGRAYGKRLRDAGIESIEDLQGAIGSDKALNKVAGDIDVPAHVLMGWVQQADLLRIEDLSTRQAHLIWAVGATGIKALAEANAAELANRAGVANAFEPKFVPVTPTKAQITSWIEAAQALLAPPAPVSTLAEEMGLNKIYIAKLARAGVGSRLELEEATATKKGREKVAEASGLPYKWVLGLSQKLGLMKIAGIGLPEADLLAQIEVTSVRKLASWNAQDLHYEMGRSNSHEPRFVAKTPTVEMATAWINAARKKAPTSDEQ